MSDNIEAVLRKFEDDVHAHYPRSIGLFPIPEYPETESRGMWSAALDAILTTLRYLAPATLLTIFWGQQSFFFALLKHVDNAFRAIIFSSEEQKQSVIRWLEETGPVQVDDLETVWRHGWILCSVLDSALPGACAGHPPTRLSLKHAQTIADHYLGVEPVFSRQELESHGTLSRHQEWRLATYLDRVRQALSKLTPSVSKPTSQRTSPETTQFTYDYVAKGSGLTASQINHKMSFKIYPTAQQTLDPGEVTILIRGPKDTYGMTVIAPILGKSQKIRQKLLGLDTKQSYTENALPITQGATYLRAYGKNDMNKTYYIPKSVYDIDIEVSKREDHVKVWYTVKLEGKYEISITSRGLSIVGSPFMMTSSNNIIGILEKENYNLEDGEEIDIVDVKTDRKVVLRIVDFVTEKMLLRENGTLEKISEAEAKILISTDVENERSCSVTEIHDHVPKQDYLSKFNIVAQNIITMNRVCKVFNALMDEKYTKSLKKENIYKHKDIPDIVNSTLTEATNPFIVHDERDKYIVPENISVSIRTEVAKIAYDEEKPTLYASVKVLKPDKPEEINVPATPDSLERIPEEDNFEEDIISIDRSTPLSANNPFLADVLEDFTVEKKMGTFVKTEYETNNSQNEETSDPSIKIIIDSNDTPIPSPRKNNPFIPVLDRPKTPVYKIITGELSDRVDSPYLDPKNGALLEETLANEFVNPFFTHQFQSRPHYEPPTTDFIIGAPVSLPPVIRAPSPDPPDMPSLVTTSKMIEKEQPKNEENKLEEKSEFTREEQTEVQSSATLSLHSFDSNLTDPIDNSNASTNSDISFEPYKGNTHSNRDISPRKEIWDSAYVSIDDNNSSPDNNNNEDTRQKFSPGNESYELKEQDISDMGPAERELWQSCTVLKETNKIQEEVKSYRWEIKRPIFTPIIEESDRSISSAMRDSLKHSDIDTVTVAFAELNDVYEEYSDDSEHSPIEKEPNKTILEHTETDETGVESASETLSDVIRQTSSEEGTISGVQANVTESVSASQYLRNVPKYPNRNNEIHFGDKKSSNIVLEKKMYWDEKIRQIEEKSQESARLQRKKLPSKQLKHDSLSKRKGKQMLKNFLNATEQEAKNVKQTSATLTSESKHKSQDLQQETPKADAKLVKRWKKYWDDKLEVEHEEILNTVVESTSQGPFKPNKAVEHKPIQNSVKLGTAIDHKPIQISDNLSTAVEHKSMQSSVKSGTTKDHKPIQISDKSSTAVEHKPMQSISKLTTAIDHKPIQSSDKSSPAVEHKLMQSSVKLGTAEEHKPIQSNMKPHKSNTDVQRNINQTSSQVVSKKTEPIQIPKQKVKQELPEEEVFKAFETSPKRFFGTSRKQILNKIDTFLGKPSGKIEDSQEKITGVSPDSGLVSSRISLFHNMTNTEPLCWNKSKSQSLHDIRLRKDSESTASVEFSFDETKHQDTNKTYVFIKTSTEQTDSNEHENVSLKEKRARLTQKTLNRSFDEVENRKSEQNQVTARSENKELIQNQNGKRETVRSEKTEPVQKQNRQLEQKQEIARIEIKDPVQVIQANVYKPVKEYYKPIHNDTYKISNVLRKTSISKSEMDIFKKAPELNDPGLDKHMSCDDLPKINVKNFISMYEKVSKNSVEKPVKATTRPCSVDSQNHWKPFSIRSDAEKKTIHTGVKRSFSNTVIPNLISGTSKSINSISTESVDAKTDTESLDIEDTRKDKATTYVSLSDIELEIIESSPDRDDSSPEQTGPPHIEYKNRFNKAKQFFQSLEELREVKKPRQLNECQMLLLNESTESLENNQPQKRVRKKKTKSHSMPSSELAKYWNQMQENEKNDSSKLVKISEKFNVDDLFSDVMEGRLSRQGSLRGIPHKKAVLEAFRSMENIADKKISPYVVSPSEVKYFTSESRGRDAQSYLSEYPYLPTTDPSKSHSRLDAKASGLITLKELLEKKKVRRNSVPDLRLNPKFSADL